MADERRGKPLPHNLQAERGLLGVIMTRNEVMFEIGELVRAEDFFEPANAEIFKLAKDQIEAGRGASAMVLMHDFSQDTDIGGISASEYLAMLERESPDQPSVARQLAIAVRDLSMRRQTIEVAESLSEEMRSAPATISAMEIRASYDTKFGRIMASAADMGIRSLGELAERVVHDVAGHIRDERTIGLRCGLAGVESLLGRFMPSRLYLIAGTPGAGKSALLQQIGEYVASEHGEEPAHPAMIQQAEMTGEEMAQRNLASRAGVPADRIETGSVNEQEWQQLHNAAAPLRKTRLYIDATPSPTMALCRARAIRMQRLYGLEFYGLDHLLYLAPPDPRMNTVEAIRPNLQALKRLAKDLRIPVVVLTQLKQEFAQERNIRPPTTGDLFGGSANEQEADAILFLFRAETLLRQREPNKIAEPQRHSEWILQLEEASGKVDMILAKRRGGQGWGRRTMGFLADRTRFTDDLRLATTRAMMGNAPPPAPIRADDMFPEYP